MATNSDDYVRWAADAPAPRATASCARAAILSIVVAALLLVVALWRGAALALAAVLDNSDDGTPLTCVFIHGAGSPTVEPPSASDPVYWGRVHERLACAEYRFMHEDTMHHGWDSPHLQQHVCTLFENVSAASVAVVFAHSLGNILLAGALDAGYCRLPPRAAWFAVAAPWEGSKAADKLPEVCNGDGLVIHPLVRSLATRQHFCDGVNATPSAGYTSLVTSNQRLRDVSARWVGRVNGSLCGDSPFGLWSADSMELEALADLVAFGEANDGAVPTRACHPPGATSAREPSARHFTCGCNHYDVTCRHNDPGVPWLRRDDRNPCAWYEEMTQRAREGR